MTERRVDMKQHAWSPARPKRKVSKSKRTQRPKL
jgi:hypothetical protein